MGFLCCLDVYMFVALFVRKIENMKLLSDICMGAYKSMAIIGAFRTEEFY